MCLNTCCCGHEGSKNLTSSWQGKYTPSDSAYSQCLYCPAGKSRYPPECACLNIEYDLLISASEQLYESKTDAVSEAIAVASIHLLAMIVNLGSMLEMDHCVKTVH